MGAWRRTPLALQVRPSARTGSPGPRPHAPVGSLSSRHSHVYRQRDSHPWETRVPRRRDVPRSGQWAPSFPERTDGSAASRPSRGSGARVARRGRPRFRWLWEVQPALPAPGRAPAPVLAASGPCGRYSSGRFYSCGGALHSRRVWWRSPRPPTQPRLGGGPSGPRPASAGALGAFLLRM